MLFELITRGAGCQAGLLIALLAPILLAALALLAPIPLNDDREVPGGFNPERWYSLGIMATSQQSPWSIALMAAGRLRWLVGGSLGAIAMLVFVWIGYAERLRLQDTIRAGDRELTGARDARDRSAQRIGDLETQLREAKRQSDQNHEDYERMYKRAMELDRANRDQQAQILRLTNEKTQNQGDQALLISNLQAAAAKADNERQKTEERFWDYIHKVEDTVKQRYPDADLPKPWASLPPDPKAPAPANARPPR